ncbi:MAG: sigma-54-dependent Fis family transcriptional regulator [Deltaproteobacteria bacterium]|nr:MAG: sigma-54-dependent Fis family transcriptional regulator [Deltaproteobacteria bacterium]
MQLVGEGVLRGDGGEAEHEAGERAGDDDDGAVAVLLGRQVVADAAPADQRHPRREPEVARREGVAELVHEQAQRQGEDGDQAEADAPLEERGRVEERQDQVAEGRPDRDPPQREEVQHVHPGDNGHRRAILQVASSRATLRAFPEAPMPLDILVVDDDPKLRQGVQARLEAAGHRVTEAADAARAVALLAGHGFDLVLCDVLLAGASGLAVFEQIRRESPETDVILVTGHGTVQDAVRALKAGATDYLTKPIEMERLAHEVGQIAERRGLEQELKQARRVLDGGTGAQLVGRTAVMQRLLERVNTIAASDAPVLIGGESGTGKELVAKILHEHSARRERPMVVVNCAAFPDTLIEAELFGHERGAFTGAFKKREGRFKAAHNGTLFLDEVSELPLQAQAKLLRVLQEGTFQPLGSNETVKVNVRIISATHQPLKELVAARRFREDLFYRLKVLDVRIPPLRERKGDIPALVEHFVSRFAPDRRVTGLTPRAWAAVTHHPFPGNVRELEHAIHHAVVLAGAGLIDVHHLPEELGAHEVDEPRPVTEIQPLAQALRQFEREYLLRALEAMEGNRSKTASRLGISRKNLWEKLRAHGIPGRKAGGDGDGEAG